MQVVNGVQAYTQNLLALIKMAKVGAAIIFTGIATALLIERSNIVSIFAVSNFYDAGTGI